MQRTIFEMEEEGKSTRKEQIIYYEKRDVFH